MFLLLYIHVHALHSISLIFLALHTPEPQVFPDSALHQSPPHIKTNTLDSPSVRRAKVNDAVAMSVLKSRSLPQGMHGLDPIAAALKLNRSGGGTGSGSGQWL